MNLSVPAYSYLICIPCVDSCSSVFEVTHTACFFALIAGLLIIFRCYLHFRNKTANMIRPVTPHPKIITRKMFFFYVTPNSFLTFKNFCLALLFSVTFGPDYFKTNLGCSDLSCKSACMV
jgi:hypothetical protein